MKESTSGEVTEPRKIQVLVLVREEAKPDRWLELSPLDTIALIAWLMIRGMIVKGGSDGSNKSPSSPDSRLLNQKGL